MQCMIKLVFIFFVFMICAMPSVDKAFAMDMEEERTTGRRLDGTIVEPIWRYPDWLFVRREHDQFLPYRSNHHPQHAHPAQWDAMHHTGNWDTRAWGEEKDPQQSLLPFFKRRILHKKTMIESAGGKKGLPVLEVGPRFYSLSDLDQRRLLALVAETSGIFTQRGYNMFILRDWKSGAVIGNYSQDGMFLD